MIRRNLRNRKSNRRLYESIMKDVAKTTKRHLNESQFDVDPEYLNITKKFYNECIKLGFNDVDITDNLFTIFYDIKESTIEVFHIIDKYISKYMYVCEIVGKYNNNKDFDSIEYNYVPFIFNLQTCEFSEMIHDLKEIKKLTDLLT